MKLKNFEKFSDEILRIIKNPSSTITYIPSGNMLMSQFINKQE